MRGHKHYILRHIAYWPTYNYITRCWSVYYITCCVYIGLHWKHIIEYVGLLAHILQAEIGPACHQQ